MKRILVSLVGSILLFSGCTAQATTETALSPASTPLTQWAYNMVPPDEIDHDQDVYDQFVKEAAALGFSATLERISGIMCNRWGDPWAPIAVGWKEAKLTLTNEESGTVFEYCDLEDDDPYTFARLKSRLSNGQEFTVQFATYVGDLIFGDTEDMWINEQTGAGWIDRPTADAIMNAIRLIALDPDNSFVAQAINSTPRIWEECRRLGLTNIVVSFDSKYSTYSTPDWNTMYVTAYKSGGGLVNVGFQWEFVLYSDMSTVVYADSPRVNEEGRDKPPILGSGHTIGTLYTTDAALAHGEKRRNRFRDEGSEILFLQGFDNIEELRQYVEDGDA
jgi:hypothetical protein